MSHQDSRRAGESSSSCSCSVFDGGESGAAVVTLVIAHPDDECMFFSPALEALRKSGVRTTVCCLSNGDAYGLGRVREKELQRSCETYGMARADVEVVEDKRLRDGMDEEWDPAVVVTHVERHCASVGTTHLLGFDEGGISGHPNHVACAQALVRLRSSSRPVWVQRTFGGPSQYLGALQLLLWHAFGRRKNGVVACTLATLVPALRAMRRHDSQLVWYRYLHLLLSRYVYINLLKKL